MKILVDIVTSLHPYLFLQPLKMVSSNLVGLYNLGLGSSVSEVTFGTKIGRGWG